MYYVQDRSSVFSSASRFSVSPSASAADFDSELLLLERMILDHVHHAYARAFRLM